MTSRAFEIPGTKKIRVNSINPGLDETEGAQASGWERSEFVNGLIEQTPLGRVGQPDDIGPIAVFLASDDSRCLFATDRSFDVTGQSFWPPALVLVSVIPPEVYFRVIPPWSVSISVWIGLGRL
jgi:NAD(P)-dependent dehydrogenase (short-subunit alcohol dehydrogenase family)